MNAYNGPNGIRSQQIDVMSRLSVAMAVACSGISALFSLGLFCFLSMAAVAARVSVASAYCIHYNLFPEVLHHSQNLGDEF